MKSNKVFIFVTFMSLQALGVLSDGFTDEFAGKWYVVSMKRVFPVMPDLKCWTLDVTEGSNHKFEGNVIFYDNEVSRYLRMQINGTQYMIAGNTEVMRQYFNLTMKYDSNNITVYGLGEYARNRNYPAVSQLKLDFSGFLFSQIKTLYISRDPKLPDDFNIRSTIEISNSNCPQDEQTTHSSKRK